MKKNEFLIQKSINQQNTVYVTVPIHEDSNYLIHAIASADSHWQEKGKESCLIRMYVDGEYHQDFVLFYGQSLFSYTRMLGYLKRGSYSLTFEFVPTVETESERAWLEKIMIEEVPAAHPDSIAFTYAPLLYGRNVYSSYDSVYTDTPLVMFYRIGPWNDGMMIEYQMVFSHEDEGTAAPMLMARWGRLLDIEWMVRVYVDREGNIVRSTYQGPHHVTTEYKGLYLDGSHPILQTATCNGNFTDEITSAYRFFFPPAFQWKLTREPREVVMEKFPFCNQVMLWEANRQVKYAAKSDAKHPELIAPTEYLYLHSSKWCKEDVSASIDFLVMFKGMEESFSSSFEGFESDRMRAFYEGPYPCFATTLKLPKNKTFQDVEKIEARLISDDAEELIVKNIRVFSLTEEGEFKLEIEETFQVTLTNNERKKEILNVQQIKEALK